MAEKKTKETKQKPTVKFNGKQYTLAHVAGQTIKITNADETINLLACVVVPTNDEAKKLLK
jgi:hypothetical protein